MAEEMKKSYSYFEKDGAYFRRDDSKGYQSVDDVLAGKEWKPYKGDRLKPATWGDLISEADLPL